MRTLPTGMQAHLDSGATTLCHCWKLTRTDGMVMGFTDHDRDLAFDGVGFEAEAGLTASAVESSADLSVDNLDIAGALSSLRLTDADLAAGLYDDAEVEIWRVNWNAPAQRLLMRRGNLGEVSRGGRRFTAELRGLAHRLNQPAGRLYQYGCDADLGDARCGLELGDFSAGGLIVASSGDRVLTVSGLDGFAAGFFTRGLLRFTGGANLGASGEIRQHDSTSAGVTLELWQSMSRAIMPGDPFGISAGCDKQFATCREKFSNGGNFRGFPHMPGNDYVISYPGAGDENDGGSLV